MSVSEDTRVQWRPDVDALLRELGPVMDQLEAGRLDALSRRKTALMIALLCVAFGTVAAIAVIGHDPDFSLGGMFAFGFCVVVALVLYYYLGAKPVKAFRYQFKSIAFRHAIRMVAPGMDYLPGGMISRGLFEQSRLFPSSIDSYEGEDLFHGKVGSTQISMSELHVQRDEGSGKDKRRVTVFKGIFMIVDFHKHFRCAVTIEPDFAEAAFGFLGRKLQGLSGNLLRLENPDFERAFKVRASDPVEARYLLTPDMQERFLSLRNTWSTDLRAAFRDSSLVIAIPKSGNWFEADISTPANRPEHLRRFFDELLPLLHIPTRLDLDTRIWTKE